MEKPQKLISINSIIVLPGINLIYIQASSLISLEPIREIIQISPYSTRTTEREGKRDDSHTWNESANKFKQLSPTANSVGDIMSQGCFSLYPGGSITPPY